MQTIWEQRPDEDDRQYKAFQLYCKGQSYKKITEAVGIGSKSTVNSWRNSKDWDARRAAYNEDNAVATAPNEDFVTETTVTSAENEPLENTEDILSGEITEQKNAVDGAFEKEEAGSTTLSLVADLPALSTLDQLADDFNSKIEQGDSRVKEGVMFYIAAGKALNQAKTLVKHGDWENWLKAKSKYPIRRAQKFMQLADRFGYLADNPAITGNLSVTNLFELLSLPEGEEVNFIDKLAAEGKNLAALTQKETRAEVKDYNEELAAARADADKEKSRADELQKQLDLFGDKLKTAEAETRRFTREYHDQYGKTQKARQELQDAQKIIERQAAENSGLQDKLKELEDNPVVVEIDNEETKKALEESKAKIVELQAQIDVDAAKRAEIFAKLTAAANILASLDDSAKIFIQEYAQLNPDKFNTLCSFASVD